MTISEAKQKLISWATAQLGTRESGNNWNKYAEDPRLVRLYGWSLQNQPWCDLFTDEAFIECFGLETGAAMTYQRLGAGSAACRQSAQFFKDNGAFVQTPEPGDVIFFYVGGAINHQGIVTGVDGSRISTVEGNSSDAVSARSYQIGASNIAGYGRPKWSLAAGEGAEETEGSADPAPVTKHGSCVARIPMLAQGDRGPAVAALQAALHVLKYSIGAAGIDGDFGPATAAAVKNFQVQNGLEADGEVGSQTWAKLLS